MCKITCNRDENVDHSLYAIRWLFHSLCGTFATGIKDASWVRRTAVKLKLLIALQLNLDGIADGLPDLAKANFGALCAASSKLKSHHLAAKVLLRLSGRCKGQVATYDHPLAMACDHIPKYAHDNTSLLVGRLHELVAKAPNLQAVQDALGIAFPPSQGSAKRAEKFRQFFSDVMPAGAEFKVCRQITTDT